LLYLQNKAKKSGEVERISPFKRNQTQKLVITIETQKEQSYPGEISEKSKESRDC